MTKVRRYLDIIARGLTHCDNNETIADMNLDVLKRIETTYDTKGLSVSRRRRRQAPEVVYLLIRAIFSGGSGRDTYETLLHHGLVNVGSETKPRSLIRKVDRWLEDQEKDLNVPEDPELRREWFMLNNPPTAEEFAAGTWRPVPVADGSSKESKATPKAANHAAELSPPTSQNVEVESTPAPGVVAAIESEVRGPTAEKSAARVESESQGYAGIDEILKEGVKSTAPSKKAIKVNRPR